MLKGPDSAERSRCAGSWMVDQVSGGRVLAFFAGSGDCLADGSFRRCDPSFREHQLRFEVCESGILLLVESRQREPRLSRVSFHGKSLDQIEKAAELPAGGSVRGETGATLAKVAACSSRLPTSELGLLLPDCHRSHRLSPVDPADEFRGRAADDDHGTATAGPSPATIGVFQDQARR